jgi:hypothetical protein
MRISMSGTILVSRCLFLASMLGTALAISAGCGGGSSCQDGSEKCSCFINNTCNAGLTCASGVCVDLGGSTGGVIAGAITTGGATTGGATTVGVHHGGATTGGATTGGVHHGGVTTGGAITGGVTTVGVTTGGVTTVGVTTGGATTGGVTTGGATTVGVTTGGATTGGATTVGVTTGGVATGGATTVGVTTGGVATGGATSTGGIAGASGTIAGGYGGSGGAPDLCAGNTCSGHGTCSAGACVCSSGYAGTTCSQCATGYGGYPNCAQCACSSGQQQCLASSTLGTCDDGCNWTSQSCASKCQLSVGVDKSTGCAYDWNSQHDACWCPTSTTEDIMLWTLKDTCDDGIGPSVGYYDVTSGGSWGPYFLQTYNQSLAQAIQCVTGHSICFGAWDGLQYWGCGQGCVQSCTSCCLICGSHLSTPVELLTCI